jgi:GntR family transcriptional regulator, transcriptional repressor for pyruvate dehydrogenase complex
MNQVFKKIKVQKLSEEIAGQIRDLVTDGKLQSGEKLPPERKFSEMLGVGRSSLREAINILETQGFVETRKRQGLFVKNLSTSILPDPLLQMLEEDKDKLTQLYEVRQDIELAAAWAAAEQRTEDDLEKMKKILKKMEADNIKSVLDIHDDLEFHLAIAQSSRNIFRGHILKNIFDISYKHLHYATGVVTAEKTQTQKLLEQHQHIFLAIKKQDPAMARTTMINHLLWADRKWRDFAN